MKERVEVLISAADVDDRVKEMADQISHDYAGKEIFMICILKGSVVFMSELAKKLNHEVTFNFMKVSSYGNATESSGRIKIDMDLDDSVKGKDVLIIEDIVDTGRTLKHLKDLLSLREPASLKICTLLDKPSRRVADVKVDYTGFVIPDDFVIGYGLDYAQRYRNLDFIGVLRFDEE